MKHYLLTAYIDPGVGSMLFTILIGLAATAVYFLRTQWIRLKYAFQGGKAEEKTAEKLPYVIFSDSKRYWNVFGPICDEFERRGIAAQYWTMSPDDPALSQPYRHVKTLFIGEGGKAFARLNAMNASVCLSTTPGLDVYQWKRSKNTDRYVHLFHALDTGLTYRMFGLDYYDAVLLTGDFSARYIREMEEKRGLPAKDLTVTGSTYMDTIRERLLAHPVSARPEGQTPLILLAPSWGPSSILNRYGSRFISALLETGYRVAVRPHPQSKTSEAGLLQRLMEEFPDSDRLSWNYDNDNFDILSRADVLISDFSGVIFDFTLGFDKPMLYADTSFDPGPYDLAWSEQPNWYFEALPRLGRQLREEDFGRLKEILEELMASDNVKDERDSIRRAVWQYVGESAVRTVDYLTGKEA